MLQRERPRQIIRRRRTNSTERNEKTRREQRAKHESMMRWRTPSARIVTLLPVVVGATRGNYSSALPAHIVPDKHPPLRFQHSCNFNGNSSATIKGRREIIRPRLLSRGETRNRHFVSRTFRRKRSRRLRVPEEKQKENENGTRTEGERKRDEKLRGGSHSRNRGHIYIFNIHALTYIISL